MSDQDREFAWRLFVGVALAVLLAPVLSADLIWNGCSEQHFRTICGEWWYQCWLASGCWIY